LSQPFLKTPKKGDSGHEFTLVTAAISCVTAICERETSPELRSPTPLPHPLPASDEKFRSGVMKNPIGARSLSQNDKLQRTFMKFTIGGDVFLKIPLRFHKITKKIGFTNSFRNFTFGADSKFTNIFNSVCSK